MSPKTYEHALQRDRKRFVEDGLDDIVGWRKAGVNEATLNTSLSCSNATSD
jgi:hypothetical protein